MTPELHQRLIGDPGRAAEQQRPAERARHHRDQQGAEHDQQEDGAPGALHAVEDVGLGRAEQNGQQRHQHGDAERAREHLVEIAVGQHLAPVLQDEDPLDALVLAPVVEREQHRHDDRDQHDADEQRKGRRRQDVRRARDRGGLALPRWSALLMRRTPPRDRTRMSAASHPRRTSSPSLGFASPSFWSMMVTVRPVASA